MRPPKQVTVGAGRLEMRGFIGEVAYEFKGDPATIRRSRLDSSPTKPLAGLIRTKPEVATEAFREGRCFLTLEDGRQWTLTVVAHTEGEDHAYVEARVS